MRGASIPNTPLPMITELTQSLFESAVPALTNADSQVFDRVYPFVVQASGTLDRFLAGTPLPPSLDLSAARLACIMGARRAVPHLDLVVTGSGFGIVSNQTLAPASAHRVSALAESLRREESDVHDSLVFELLSTSWSGSRSAASYVSALLFCPTLMRRYGVRFEGGDVYAREFAALRPLHLRAVARAERVISPELMSELVRRARIPIEEDADLYARLSELVCSFIASDMMDALAPSAELHLLEWVRRHEHRLPQYADSATAFAHRLTPYRNELDHPTFFFG